MTLRDWITLGAAVVLIITAFVWGMRCGSQKIPSQQIVLHDTVRIREIITDTVLKWYERIVWREVEPDTIVVNLFVDTIAPETIWGSYPEAIIALDYRRKRFNKGDLRFVSIKPRSFRDSTRGGGSVTDIADTGVSDVADTVDRAVLKEYTYEVSNRFEIRSKGDGFHVRTRRPGLGFGVGVGVGAGTQLLLVGDTLAPRFLPFVSASVNYRGLSLGPRLDTRGLHLNLKYEWRW